MNLMDFFRLATQSGAKYEPETQRFQMGPAEMATFGMLQEQENIDANFNRHNCFLDDEDDRL